MSEQMYRAYVSAPDASVRLFTIEGDLWNIHDVLLCIMKSKEWVVDESSSARYASLHEGTYRIGTTAQHQAGWTGILVIEKVRDTP